jgi:thioredoxin-like negative regulator of GroEL
MEVKVIKLSSPFCAPCKTLDKNLEGKNYENIDVTVDKDLALEHGIRRVPTTLFFLNGELKEKVSGVFTADEYDGFVEAILNGAK